MVRATGEIVDSRGTAMGRLTSRIAGPGTAPGRSHSAGYRQAWMAFDSKSVQATAHIRRTCQIMQLWADGNIRYWKWIPLDDSLPFPL